MSWSVVWGLGQIGEDAVPALIQILQDQDVGSIDRVNAARVLGEIGKEITVSALMQALQNKHEMVRQGAAQALTKIGTPEALKAIEEYQSRQ